MIELTEQQVQVLAANGTGVARAVDPATRTEYVLVGALVYDRIQQFLADKAWAQDAYAAAQKVFGRAGWDDPRMDD